MTDHHVRVVETERLSDVAHRSARQLMEAAFAGDFSDEDWQHALGGWHALIGPDDAVVAHAAVVERRIVVGTRACRAGYVEAVAVAPALQRRGLGTRVMQAIGEIIQARFDIGVLSTGEWGFYAPLGWERWSGPTYVRTAHGDERTPDDDDGVMVLRCIGSREVDLAASITCDARDGDSW